MVPFLYGPILPQRSHFSVGLWWATGPTIPWYWPNFTLNYGVMMSHWIFSVLLELIIVNWNPFQRWFSEVAPVSWHISFNSRSCGWGLKARFVIFGCSLPHLTLSSEIIVINWIDVMNIIFQEQIIRRRSYPNIHLHINYVRSFQKICIYFDRPRHPNGQQWPMTGHYLQCCSALS